MALERKEQVIASKTLDLARSCFLNLAVSVRLLGSELKVSSKRYERTKDTSGPSYLSPPSKTPRSY